MFMTDTIFKNLFQKNFMDWKTNQYLSDVHSWLFRIVILIKFGNLILTRFWPLFGHGLFHWFLCSNMYPLSCGLHWCINLTKWCGWSVFIKTTGREIYRDILFYEFYWFFTSAKRKEGCGGLNISYLTSSPKPLHGFRKKTWREASTQGLLSSLFILGILHFQNA